MDRIPSSYTVTAQDTDLISFIAAYEGFSAVPYRCPAGKWTIGFGHNMEAHGVPAHLVKAIFDGKGITRKDAEQLLVIEVAQCISAARNIVPDFDKLGRPRQFVVVDMIYNLGPAGFRKFTRTITAIVAGRFIDAAKHMQQSKWFGQVGLRSKRNVRIMREGKL